MAKVGENRDCPKCGKHILVSKSDFSSHETSVFGIWMPKEKIIISKQAVPKLKACVQIK